jgi:hypothetical protein
LNLSNYDRNDLLDSLAEVVDRKVKKLVDDYIANNANNGRVTNQKCTSTNEV